MISISPAPRCHGRADITRVLRNARQRLVRVVGDGGGVDAQRRLPALLPRPLRQHVPVAVGDRSGRGRQRPVVLRVPVHRASKLPLQRLPVGVGRSRLGLPRGVVPQLAGRTPRARGAVARRLPT